MDIIGIYVGSLYFPADKMHKWDENNLISGGIGGSEIWAIEIASQFENKGYHCIVFADCNQWHYTDNGVEYVPENEFNNVCLYTKFKYFITSRKVFELNDSIQAERIYLMAHDPFILWCNTYDDLKMPYIYKIAYQSDFQKRLLKDKYKGLTDNDFFKTFQAINPNLYGDASYDKKKNKMLWCSHKIRGARLLIEKILPIIREEIPDFEIDVCGYVNDMTDGYFNAEGVNLLGNITKEEVVKRQKESKIWIYPNWGKFEDGRINDETFCIAAIENAFAKNAIVVADRTCFSSTLKGYSGFVGTELFGNSDILDESKINEFCNILARQAIELLKDNDRCIHLAEEGYDICKEYTWENASLTFINDFNSDFDKKDDEIINEESVYKPTYNVIFLTACFRTENLIKIFNSIYDNFKDSPLQVTWILSHDIYNAGKESQIEDIRNIIELCKSFQKENPKFGWRYVPCGKENQKNYGGDMFNMPLISTIKEYYDNNEEVWVYILDDDNIINSLMAESLYDAITVAEKKGKSVIYYNIMYENGICAPVCHETYYPMGNRTNVIPYYHVTDPSQLVMKYKVIKDMGFYKPYLKYDEDIFAYLNYHLDILCFPEEWDRLNRQYLNRYQTYHNGITSKEDKEKWLNIIYDNSKKKSCVLSICTNEDANKMFHINEKDIEEIYKKYIYE